ncbi:MAG: NlpC/P60 family protein [Saprospiraceae bacterium]|nr:NlpC/P60 family protein [Saprospiraceae bacterium]
MNTKGHQQSLGLNNHVNQQFTAVLPILSTLIFVLFFISAQAESTKQNEKFNKGPFPNPKTLMKLTATHAANTVTAVTVAPMPVSTIVASSPVVAVSPIASSVSTPTITASAPVLTTTTTSITERRQNVAWFAASYSDWGFKYQSGSSSYENGGFDCSGFVAFVLNYFDIKTKRSAAEQFNEGTSLPVEMARPGDLVFFGGKNKISHVAMVVSNDDKGLVVVHSTSSKGVTQENITESKYWKGKLKDKAVNIVGE